MTLADSLQIEYQCLSNDAWRSFVFITENSFDKRDMLFDPGFEHTYRHYIRFVQKNWFAKL